MDGTQQQGRSLFQSLPLEIRRQIYSYILPYTVPQYRRKETYVWRLGSIAILAANKQIHEEAADLLYGDSWFHFVVQYNRTEFVFHFVRQGILRETRHDEYLRGYRHIQAVEYFIKRIGPKNVSRIRQLQIHIHGPADFKAGKYNEVPAATVTGPPIAINAEGPTQYPPTPEG